MLHWRLASDGRTAVVCSQTEWMVWMAVSPPPPVGDDTLEGMRVSTVFLGYGDAPWETMVFDIDGNDYSQERYQSYTAALAGHRAACRGTFGTAAYRRHLRARAEALESTEQQPRRAIKLGGI